MKIEASMIRKTTLPLTLALIGGLCVPGPRICRLPPRGDHRRKETRLPGRVAGQHRHRVFGFGKDSSDKVGVWLESLSADNNNAWSVVNLETVPSVARPAIRIGMRKGTPALFWDGA